MSYFGIVSLETPPLNNNNNVKTCTNIPPNLSRDLRERIQKIVSPPPLPPPSPKKPREPDARTPQPPESRASADTTSNLPPALREMLDRDIIGAPVGVLAHATYQTGQAQGRPQGYLPFCNTQWKKQRHTPLCVDQDSSYPLFQEMQKTVPRITDDNNLNTSSMTIVSVERHVDNPNTPVLLRYNYFCPAYKDTAGRPGSILNVCIELPPDKALKILRLLKSNPGSVQEFFKEATQGVDLGDYIRKERWPENEKDESRMFFIESDRLQSASRTFPSINVLTRKFNNWTPDTLSPPEEKALGKPPANSGKGSPKPPPIAMLPQITPNVENALRQQIVGYNREIRLIQEMIRSLSLSFMQRLCGWYYNRILSLKEKLARINHEKLQREKRLSQLP